MMSKQLVLGHQSARNPANPAKVKNTVYKMQCSALPSSVNTGGCYQIIADTGPVYPGNDDTVGTYATGFKLTDFLDTNSIKHFDYFRIKKIELVASVSRFPRPETVYKPTTQVMVYSSVDWDSAAQVTFGEFMKRENKNLVVLTDTAPTQKLLEYVPRRRISTNVDPSQQRVTNPDEWLDVTYASTLLFGNVKHAICVPDGQISHPVSNQCRVLVTATLWVEFKGRLN